MPTSFLLDIQRIVPGGRGIGFHQGQAVFAPLAVPGDRLEVLRWTDRKGYLEVLESHLIDPSPERVSPPCSYFGSCGGCDFQQMSDSQQLAAKQDILIDALRRVGKVHIEPSQIRLHASESSGYRNRLQLKLVQSGEGFSWGFYKTGSHEVCSVESCLIASKALWEQLEILRTQLGKVPQIATRLDEVEVFWGDGKECLVTLSLRDVPPDFNEIIAEMQLAKESLASRRFSVALIDSKGQRHLLCGSGFVWKTVGGFLYQVSHGAFFQVNDPMMSVLQRTATQGLAGQSALELFSGVGFFTVPLSRNFTQIEVLEGNPLAVNDLEENLRVNRAENCRISGSDLSDALRAGRWRSGQFDLLFIDPPRSGLPKATIEAVARLGCPNFAYVSCDPATLARDLRILLSSGYEIVSLDLLDLFPQTHHLETIARLRKP